MTTSVTTTWGDIDGVWTTSDVENLPLAQASLADGIRDLVDGYQPNYATVADILATTPAANSWATADNAPGARFQYVSSTWVMTGIPRFATSAARNAALTAPAAGWLSRVDTDRFVRYATGSGTTWVPYGSGLFQLIPSSVSGTNASLGTSGVITLAAATSASVNGCFTTAFANYRLVFDMAMSAAATLDMVLRASSTDTTTGYDRSRTGGTGTGGTASTLQALNSASWVISAASLIGRHNHILDIFNPQVASTVTTCQYTSTATDNPMTAAAAQAQGVLQQRATTQFDGFTITPASGNLTGTLRIYGYNNN